MKRGKIRRPRRSNRSREDLRRWRFHVIRPRTFSSVEYTSLRNLRTNAFDYSPLDELMSVRGVVLHQEQQLSRMDSLKQMESHSLALIGHIRDLNECVADEKERNLS